jgi:hypothetical protein
MQGTGFTRPDLRSKGASSGQAEFAVRDSLNILHVYEYLDRQRTPTDTRPAASRHCQQSEAER